MSLVSLQQIRNTNAKIAVPRRMQVTIYETKVETNGQQHLFEVEVYLNYIAPKAVRVELYAEGINDSRPLRQKMKRGRQLTGEVKGYIYSVMVSATRPATDYTARVIPNYDSVAIPLEAAQILWQR